MTPNFTGQPLDVLVRGTDGRTRHRPCRDHLDVRVSLHFLHILSVIVWVGGVIALNVLAVRVGRGPDRPVQAALLGLSDTSGAARGDRPGRGARAHNRSVARAGGGSGIQHVLGGLGLVGLFVSVILGATPIEPRKRTCRG
jgi:hypothetical protein